MSIIYEAAVIGAGPGGLAAVCGVLDRAADAGAAGDGGTPAASASASPSSSSAHRRRVLWIDRSWSGGRLNERYRSVSSNTKVGIYLDALAASPTCARILDAHPGGAVGRMRALDREATCGLDLAGDVVRLLIEEIGRLDGVDTVCADVERAEWTSEPGGGGTWALPLPGSPRARELVLATGSLPLVPSWHERFNPSLSVIDLDTALCPPLLADALPAGSPAHVAVVGGSHSGILALRNLYELGCARDDDASDASEASGASEASEASGRGGARGSEAARTAQSVPTTGLGRHPIRYAEYTDAGVVWDNTGLKGATADWARDVLERGSAHGGQLEFVVLPADEAARDGVYRRVFSEATHIVYAVGYGRAPAPALIIDGERAELDWDPALNGFRWRGRALDGLRGAGIAFPKRSTDPHGHDEDAVGIAKFFKFDRV